MPTPRDELLSSKMKRLEKAGYRFKVPLPAKYEEVFDKLTAAEIAALVSVKTKLDKAEVKTDAETGSYLAYFHPF